MGLARLRVVQVWRGEAIEERSFTWAAEAIISVGQGGADAFNIPEEVGALALFRAVGGGFALRIAPGMAGTLHLGVRKLNTADVPGEHVLGGGDWGIVAIDQAGEHAFYFEQLRGDTDLPARFNFDGFLVAALGFAFFIHIAVLGVSYFIAEPVSEDDLAASPERVARLILDKEWPAKPTPDEVGDKKKHGPDRKAREEDTSKRAAGKEGKFGDPKSAHKDSKIAKGPRDVIVQRVQSTGLLGLTRSAKGDSSIAKLLSSDKDAEMSTALLGLEGVKTQIGSGPGGMATRGSGPGGGGPGGQGQLFGTGDLKVGGGHGQKPHVGGGLGGGAKEKMVDIAPTNATSDGSLTKEQIYKVVASHQSAIKFCYETQLQRFPHLAGKVVLTWRVELDGRVSAASIGSSSMGNPGAEGCMVRQLKTWVFPKPQGTVAQVSFPFVFKGE
jgi:hypothetical protein